MGYYHRAVFLVYSTNTSKISIRAEYIINYSFSPLEFLLLPTFSSLILI